MKKTLSILNPFLIAFIGNIFLTFTINAQQSAQIDVKSIKLYKQAFWTSTILTMNADGLSDSSFAGGNFGIFSFEGCQPCELGRTFTTSFTPNNFITFFRGGPTGNIYVRLILNGTSSNFILHPNLRKKHLFINIPSRIQGRVEILDENFLVTAVDNDVDLNGVINLDFNSYYNVSRRLFNFNKMTYEYSLTN